MDGNKDPYDHDRLPLGRELFERIIEPPSGDVRDTLYIFVRTATIVVAVFLSLLVFLTIILQSPENIGQAGDFFGGFVNPLLTFLTFSGVLFTVYIQRQDLNETRKETKKQAEFFERQNFEATFFQMLNLHNGIVSELEISEYNYSSPFKGRGTFPVYYSKLQEKFNNIHTQALGSQSLIVSHAFHQFWDGARQDLGHYYRYLYNIIRYVHEAHLPATAEDMHTAKMRYMKLLRAQLSDFELLLLYYNSITGNGRRFLFYVNAYELLDNMPRNLLLKDTHLLDFPEVIIRPEPIDK